MSTLMVDFIISLDGYGAGEGWPGFWGMEEPEYLAWLGEDNQEELVHLMGATTYRLMAGFAGQADDPGSKALNAAQCGVLVHDHRAAVVGQLRTGQQ